MKTEKSMNFPLKNSCKIEANNVSICKMHSVHEGIKKAFYFRAFLFVFCSDKTIAHLNIVVQEPELKLPINICCEKFH